MKRLLVLLALGVSSMALDRLLALLLFESNVVASLLSPSSATAISSALVALLFLLNRVLLYVALPALCCATLAAVLLSRVYAPRAPAESASR